RFSRDWSSDVCSSDLTPFRPSQSNITGKEIFRSIISFKDGSNSERSVFSRFLRCVSRINSSNSLSGIFLLQVYEAFTLPFKKQRSEERRVGKEGRLRS